MIQLDCILMQVPFYFGNHPKGLYCFVILKILFFSLVEAKSEGINKEQDTWMRAQLHRTTSLS